MELSTNALTTVENAIAALKTYPFLPTGISFEDPDVTDEVKRLINAWSGYIEALTNNSFGLKEYTEFYKGTNQPVLNLKHYPIKEITSIEQISANGVVTATLDLDVLMQMMDASDLEHGMIYLEPRFAQRFTSIGIVPEAYTSLRSYKIVYTAGFVLPKDATEEIPSDVPAVLENLVIELVRSQFISNTDSIRANNLVGLTEGNVQRLWAPPTEFKLNKSQEKIISLFKRKGI